MRSFLLFLPLVCLSAEEVLPDRSLQKQQILYLAEAQNAKESISRYKLYKGELGRHDFEILEKMAISWIEQSARSLSAEEQLLGIFSLSLAALPTSSDILESALLSASPQIQSAALQYLGRMQEDWTAPLFNKAMSSQFLYTRLEAAFYLAQKKSKTAAGQIESLMYRLPPPMRYFFPEFFATIGTPEAISTLRHLMNDSFAPTQSEAILSAARHGRDDLLPPIRAAATHPNASEQEASAAALGYLKDMRSLKKLQKLTKNASIWVELSALQALHTLGDKDAASRIAERAKEENLFAIALLSHIPGQEEVLYPLLKSPNRQVEFNAAWALLHQKDPRSLSTLVRFLIKDSQDIGFQPISSPAGSLQAWKVVSSLQERSEESFFDIEALSLSVREYILRKASTLPQTLFLQLAETLLQTKQNNLLPTLIHLLEQMKTPEAITFLEEQSKRAGAPLARAYCNLALFRMGQEGPYQEMLLSFIQNNISHELIHLRASVPWNMRLSDEYHLTPEENSSLLIEAYETLVQKSHQGSIDLLLEAISEGNPRNKAVLSAILIHALH